ncbi:hypothetical protein Pla175_19500 [Pirellulimonas nuda]|uniref:Dockerin domain-containing protein n=1 Tax=Pirellulimonas nuda TaxID=2528009 RepID=A0A518DAS5_9BACT|nr:hypothetical protein [Pirellulimonas nuda]QDU88572.1 hypothetical protein Pla175_19500 [Pirellulimonas nuda]
MTHRISSPWLLTLALCCVETLGQTTRVPVGLNLTGVNYYSRELPFIDLMKGAGWNNGTPFNYDGNMVVRDDGYPAQINSGSAYRLFDKPIGVAGGEYVLLYDGVGSVSITDGYNASSGRIHAPIVGADQKKRYTIRINATSPSDPVRNLRLVPAALESSYQAGEPSNPFRQEFLDSWSMMDGFRFMDWQDTNGNPISAWSERTLTTDSTQASDNGVAIEYQIALANQAGINPWFNVPHLADDNFVRSMAETIRDQANPALNIRVELSNEVWNGQFQQAQYAIQQGLVMEPSQEPWIAGQHWYAKRSAEVFQIFEEVFTRGGADPQGMQRLTRVIGSQAGNSSMIDRIMEYGDIAENVDAIAIAPYVQGVIRTSSTNPDAAQIKAWTSEQRWEWFRGQFDDAVARMERYAAKAQTYGVDLFAYEGGQHLVAHGVLNQDQQLVDIFSEMNREPEMRDLYRQMLEEWQRVGGKDFMLFSSTSAFGGFGSWGLKEYENQSIFDTPKLQGVLDYLAGTTPEPPPAPSGVVFSDNFELDPGASGGGGRVGSAGAWLQSDPSAWSAATVAGNTVALSSSNQPTSLTRTVDTTGMHEIAVQLTAFQEGAETYETLEDLSGLAPNWSDYLQIRFDLADGNGWQRLLLDHGAWQGQDQPASAAWASEAGAAAPVSTAVLALPSGAENNANLRVQIEVYGSKVSEVWRIDQVTVFGQPIVAIAGDYNGDGAVDAADYTVWRDTLGASLTPGTGADGDADGQIGPGDYQVWRQSIGAAAAAPAQAVQAPEPATWSMLAAFALLAWPGLRSVVVRPRIRT